VKRYVKRRNDERKIAEEKSIALVSLSTRLRTLDNLPGILGVAAPICRTVRCTCPEIPLSDIESMSDHGHGTHWS
jgi:hypothetical protein